MQINSSQQATVASTTTQPVDRTANTVSAQPPATTKPAGSADSVTISPEAKALLETEMSTASEAPPTIPGDQPGWPPTPPARP